MKPIPDDPRYHADYTDFSFLIMEYLQILYTK